MSATSALYLCFNAFTAFLRNRGGTHAFKWFSVPLLDRTNSKLPFTHNSLFLQLERCLCVLVEMRREKLGNNLFCFLFSLFPNHLSRKLSSLPLWLLFSYQSTKRSSTSVKRSMLRGHPCPYTSSLVCSDVKNSFYIVTRTLIFCLPFQYCRNFHVVVLASLPSFFSPLFGFFNR